MKKIFWIVLACITMCTKPPRIAMDKDDKILSNIPDAADVNLSLNEKPASPIENLQYQSDAQEAEKKMNKINEEVNRLKKHLNTDDISSISNSDMWKNLLNYILDHIKDFMVDGALKVPFVMRYSFCTYIVAFIPAEVVFPIPSFYNRLIPDKVRKIPIIEKALNSFDKFLNFVKNKSSSQFFVDCTFGRSSGSIEDLKFLLEIPNLITSDPERIIQFFLNFELGASGFNDK